VQANHQTKEQSTMLSILNNIPALQAENELDITTNEANTSLQQLATGSRINSGSDDPAGLAISDGLNANVAALNQSSQNVTDGVGLLQTADGALSQVTSLLNQAVTIATEAANSTVSTTQDSAINTEYQAILTEINNINGTTNYNGQSIFGSSAAAATFSIFTSDGTSSGQDAFSISITSTGSSALGLTGDLSSSADAQAELTQITAAITTVSAQRGTLGANVNQLQAASSVDTTESQNLASASSDITSADIGATVAKDTTYSVLEQTGISALQQADTNSQNVLKLLQ
jgi:flagellin